MLRRHHRETLSLIAMAVLLAAVFPSPLSVRASSPAAQLETVHAAGDAESLDDPNAENHVQMGASSGLASPRSMILPGFAYLPLIQVAPPIPFERTEPLPAWTVQWWQWMEQLGSSPVYDFGNVDCSQGQTGSVWFLAGSFEEPNTEFSTRRCTIPAGKRLMAPLYTAVWVNFPGENFTVAEKFRDLDETFSDAAPGSASGKICDLVSTINGMDVAHTRLQSGPFLYSGDPETVQDGYWIAFDLGPGTHEIHIGGTLCDFDAPPQPPGQPNPWSILDRVDVTYFVTVQ